MANARQSALFLLTAGVLLAACTTTPPPEQVTGVLTGEIRFTGTSPELQAYLAAHPARAGTTVRLYPAGSLTAAATTGYDLTAPGSNSALSSSTWKVAPYSATVPVAAAGTQFLVKVDPVWFAGTGSYRFGFEAAGTAASHLSPLVEPSGTVTFHVEECAAMVPVHVKLAGETPQDMAPLEADPSLVYTCIADAAVADAGSGLPTAQARSTAATFNLATLTGSSGGRIEFPVRAHGQATTFSASCTTPAPAGSGYTQNNQGLTSFAAQNTTTATVSCGSGTGGSALEVVLPVKRTAGNLAGRFDIVGYPESYAQVTLSVPGSNVYRNATPDPLPSPQPDPASWSMTAVPAGDAIVTAGASIVGGNLGLQLPATKHPNPAATIVAGQSLDLGATFVARPIETAGSLLLVDPARSTWLGKLVNGGPVTWSGGQGDTSYMQAIGDMDNVDAPPGSAVGGMATGRLNGAYDPTRGCYFIFSQGCWELNYRLLFSGLSPVAGALDGSGSRRTAWEVDRATFNFADTTVDHTQTLSVSFGRDMRFYSKAPNAAPAQLPTMGICMGQVELDFVADAATGVLFRPGFTFQNATVTASNTAIAPSDVITSYGSATGRPAQEPGGSQQGGSGRVVATVPEGAAYQLQPTISIRAAGAAAATQVSGLARVRLPATGTLACSQVERACIKINSPAGSTAQALQVSIGNQSYCRAGGTVALQVSVDSGGVPVQEVSYKVGSGAAVPYCGSANTPACGAMSAAAPITITPAGQPFTGPQTIEVTARSDNGCIAVASYAFNACTVVQSTRQLAFFDINRLKIMRLEDNQQMFPAVNVAGGAGPISFNGAGSKLAVRQFAQVRIFSAVTGAELEILPGTFGDFAFRPGANSGDDRAMIESLGAGFPVALRAVLGGVALAPAAIPDTTPTPGVSLTSWRLAWSRDGSRVAVAFRRQQGPGDFKLVVVEWPVVGNALGVPTTFAGALPQAEQLRAFAYHGETAGPPFLFATSDALYRSRPDGSLEALGPVSVAWADLHRPGFLGLITAQGGTPAFLLVDGTPVPEPTVGQIWGIGVSDFALSDPVFAVARAAAAGSAVHHVALYRLVVQGNTPTLVQDRTYPAQEPAFPTFRPLGP